MAKKSNSMKRRSNGRWQLKRARTHARLKNRSKVQSRRKPNHYDNNISNNKGLFMIIIIFFMSLSLLGNLMEWNIERQYQKEQTTRRREKIEMESIEWMKERYGEDWEQYKEEEPNEWYLKENKEQKERETREWDSKSSSF